MIATTRGAITPAIAPTDRVFALTGPDEAENLDGFSFHNHSAPSLLAFRARSKSFPAQSNSYKRCQKASLYFEWVTDGTPDAYLEIRRSGAQRGVPRRTSARGFLGRPLHLMSSLPRPFPPKDFVIPNTAP